MSKHKIFDFLQGLRENNSKEWMDENRQRYHEAKDIWLEEVAGFLKRLSPHDSTIEKLSPKQTIMRINNNNMFHPDKPTYKDSFGFDPYKGRNRPAFYVHLSPSGSFLYGGLWRPDSDALKKMREAIDYDGEELMKIVGKKSFQNFFGGLEDDYEALKTSPQGYSSDHKHIDLLRRKNTTVVRRLTQEEVIRPDFIDTVERGFVEMAPFLGYLRRAVEFEE
ncbi:MAG: hypothetical protein ACI81P_002952 [Neolewinella sp.]|jgi:uncharacterized protein (TIGR02453 family)